MVLLKRKTVNEKGNSVSTENKKKLKCYYKISIPGIGYMKLENIDAKIGTKYESDAKGDFKLTQLIDAAELLVHYELGSVEHRKLNIEISDIQYVNYDVYKVMYKGQYTQGEIHCWVDLASESA